MGEYRKSKPLPSPHSAVRYYVSEWGDGHLFIEYWGSLAALIAAGCASRELLASPGRPGVRRRDADGDRVNVGRNSGERYRLIRVKPLATAMALPGVAAAVASFPRVAPDMPRMPAAHVAALRWRLAPQGGEPPRVIV